MNRTKLQKKIVRMADRLGLHAYFCDDNRFYLSKWTADEKMLWKVGVETSFRLKEPVFGATITREERDIKLRAALWGQVWLTLEKETWPYVDEREYGAILNASDGWLLQGYWASDMNGGRCCLLKDRLFDFLFGRMKCTTVKHGEPFETLIPMPEANYRAVLQYETRTWKRPRWPFAKVRKSTDIDIPNGVPFSGKGENSWDCGEDGLFGTGCEGHSESEAVATIVKIVHKQRGRRGDSWMYERPEEAKAK